MKKIILSALVLTVGIINHASAQSATGAAYGGNNCDVIAHMTCLGLAIKPGAQVFSATYSASGDLVLTFKIVDLKPPTLQLFSRGFLSLNNGLQLQEGLCVKLKAHKLLKYKAGKYVFVKVGDTYSITFKKSDEDAKLKELSFEKGYKKD